MGKRYNRFRSFMIAFCITLLIWVTGLCFLIADVNTRRTTFSGSPLPDVDLSAWELDRLPDWVQRGFSLLPAPARMLCWIPETVGLAIPREWDRQEHAPRLPSVAARQQQEDY